MNLAVQKSWFAVLNENDIVEEVLQMPSSVEGDEFVKLEDEDQSLVGKRYNRVTGEFEVAEYYYAEVDEKGIVVEIITSPTLENKDNWIQISAPDQSLIGKWYDKENDRFIDPPAFITAAHSTDEICYKHEDKWLSKKLDEMETAITEVEKQEGPQGPQGEDGAMGPQGEQGPMGSQGAKGDKGDTGAGGTQGPQGLKGDAGIQGPKGDKGEVGATGAQGLQGIQGPKGETGTTGSQGPKGDKGDTGAVGHQGPQGIQGVKGDKGAVGPRGLQGAAGEVGSFVLKRSTNYQKGDIVESENFPSWACIECSVGGTTSTCDIKPLLNSIGQKYADGSCEWIIRHKGEMRNVGDIWMTKAQFNKDGYAVHKMTGLVMLDCHICDGKNGSIDLLNKFTMGTNAASTGAMGGANSLTLTATQMPVHSHGASAWTDAQGNHNHAVMEYAGITGENQQHIASDTNGTAGGGTGYAGNHGHNVGVSIANAGGGQAFDNRPAFVALAFVQKIY